MASYTVPVRELGAYEKTLTPSTVDTVTFSDLSFGRGAVEVINEGTTGIYFTVNGTAPTVGATAAYYVPPSSVRTVPADDSDGTVVVKLISSGTPKYSVAEAV